MLLEAEGITKLFGSFRAVADASLAVEEGVGTIEHGALAEDDDIGLMVERRTWLVCTFGIFLHPTGIEQGDGRRPAIMEKMRWARRLVDERFPRHLASGVRFACGTDSMHGLMSFELATLVRLGVPPVDALLAATRWGAEACRVGDMAGTIEAGKRADLLAIEGIKGESTDSKHPGTIEVESFSWGLSNTGSSSAGTGRIHRAHRQPLWP